MCYGAHRIIHSSQFRQDVDEAWDYYAVENPDYADRLIRQVADKLLMLAEFPRMGRPQDELQPGLRSFVLDRYVIYYRQADTGIEAVRLLHSARDIDSLF